MANPEHLAVLEQGVEKWNEWRNENLEIKPDLERAVLNWMNLDNYVLTDSNLKQVQLRDASLRGTALQEAVLYNADLLRADFTFAKLNKADLRYTASNFVNFAQANLTEADLRGSDLTNVNFTWANLHETGFADVQLGGSNFGHNNLSTAKGLDAIRFLGSSAIGIGTLYQSVGKVDGFLRGCGVPEQFITYIPFLVGQAIQYYSCFISYSSKDQAFAERLYADLQSKGVRCWFAPEDLKIGDRHRFVIDDSIRLHEKLLLILSENSIASDWVEKEVETALEKERERKKTVLFPVRLDEAVSTIKSGWAADVRRTRHIGDFSQWKNHDEYGKVFERLLRDLKVETPTETEAS
jgi:hypothetical protein